MSIEQRLNVLEKAVDTLMAMNMIHSPEIPDIENIYQGLVSAITEARKSLPVERIPVEYVSIKEYQDKLKELKNEIQS